MFDDAPATARGGGARRRSSDDATTRDDAQASDDEEINALKINEKYAARFEHNERRKETHRLQAKLEREYARGALRARGDGKSESETATESSDGTSSDEEETLERALDGAFAEALMKIRRKDPSVYDAETKLFDEASEDEDDEDGGGKKEATSTKRTKKKTRATLREVVATQLLEGGATALEEAEAEAEAARANDEPSYVEEQAALKRAFKDAAAGGDDDEDDEDESGLVVKRRAAAMTAATEKLSEYFDARRGDANDLSAEDKFLRDYLLEKQWMKEDSKKDSAAVRFQTLGPPSSDEDDDAGADDESSDSELLDRAEAFEHKYNFRFEEPGADRLVSHSRHIEGLVRREDSKRKDKRKKVRERKESERAKLLAEVRRLKNLKREEIANKMRQISAVGGLKGGGAKVADLTEEFDPEAHDRAMQEMYGDEYYDAAGEDGEDEVFGELEKPEFGDLEEEMKELLKGAGKPDDDDLDDDDHFDDDDEPAPDEEEEENKFSKRAAKKWRKELEAKMDEYYKLNAEDFIGEAPTRFPYKEVAPKMFGLTTRDVLLMEDKHLNQIVGLKKLAPYRDDANDAAVDANQRARARRMAKEFLEKAKDKKNRSSRRRKDKTKREDDDEASDGSDDDAKARARSYADSAFGKKRKSEAPLRNTTADDASTGVGKNARKNAKKRAKRKAKEIASAAV